MTGCATGGDEDLSSGCAFGSQRAVGGAKWAGGDCAQRVDEGGERVEFVVVVGGELWVAA